MEVLSLEEFKLQWRFVCSEKPLIAARLLRLFLNELRGNDATDFWLDATIEEDVSPALVYTMMAVSRDRSDCDGEYYEEILLEKEEVYG